MTTHSNEEESVFDLVVVENVSEILALLIVSGFGVLLLKPVKGVLSALTFKIREADNLEIFGIKLDRTELREIIVQREILRTAIYIATVDEDFSLKEMQFLNDRANAMGGSLENLTPDAKQRILDEAVAIAAADEVIREDEYVALKRKAQELNSLSTRSMR